MQKPTLSTALSIFSANAPLTMSSLEISKLTGKEHKNVLRDIREMLEGLEIDTAQFSAVYKADNKQMYEKFDLPKRECFILVSGYNLKLRAAIIDRWQELEGAAPKPLTQIEQVRLLLESLEREEELKNLIAEGKYLSVKQLRKMYGWGTFSGKDLTALSISEGYDVKYFGGEAGEVATSVSQPGLYHIEVVTSYLREQWLDFDHDRQQRILNNGHVLPFNID